jgi:hypothetical protein
MLNYCWSLMHIYWTSKISGDRRLSRDVKGWTWWFYQKQLSFEQLIFLWGTIWYAGNSCLLTGHFFSRRSAEKRLFYRPKKHSLEIPIRESLGHWKRGDLGGMGWNERDFPLGGDEHETTLSAMARSWESASFSWWHTMSQYASVIRFGLGSTWCIHQTSVNQLGNSF